MASDYDQVCSLIKKKTSGHDKDEAAFSVMDAFAAVWDVATDGHLGDLSDLAQGIYGLLKKEEEPAPNPWFVFNGQEDRENTVTLRYKKSRGRKSKAGKGASLAGDLASVHTAGINVASTVMHGNATATTGLHMIKISAIAKSYPQSKTIGDWCDLVMRVKAAKAGIRGGQLIGGLIPGGSIPTQVAATVAKAGVKLTFTNTIYYTAAAIHWRAFQEQAISHGRGGKIGPGSRIFWEIFTKRGMTALLGQYDIAGLIREPAGWEALADKLLLI